MVLFNCLMYGRYTWLCFSLSVSYLANVFVSITVNMQNVGSYIIVPTMDLKPSVSVLFGHYSLPWRPILTKLGRTKFEKTT